MSSSHFGESREHKESASVRPPMSSQGDLSELRTPRLEQSSGRREKKAASKTQGLEHAAAKSVATPLPVTNQSRMLVQPPLDERQVKHERMIAHKHSKVMSWRETVAFVRRLFPMVTPLEEREKIQIELVADARKIFSRSELSVQIDGEVISCPALAQALRARLAREDKPPVVIIEAAVELYLQGACGHTIDVGCYESMQRLVYQQQGSRARLRTVARDEAVLPDFYRRVDAFFSMRPRFGVFGSSQYPFGEFAHGEALHKLLSSQDLVMNTVVTSLFETGRIAHLALWSRGMPPEFIEKFIQQAVSEAQKSDDPARQRRIPPAVFVNFLLPYLPESLHCMHLSSAPLKFNWHPSDLVSAAAWAVFLLEPLWTTLFRVQARFRVSRNSVFEQIPQPLRSLCDWLLGPFRGLLSEIPISRLSPLNPLRISSASQIIPPLYSLLARRDVACSSSPENLQASCASDLLQGSVADPFFESESAVVLALRRHLPWSSIGFDPDIQEAHAQKIIDEHFRQHLYHGQLESDKRFSPGTPQPLRDIFISASLEECLSLSALLKQLKVTNLIRTEVELIAALKAVRDLLNCRNRLAATEYTTDLLGSACLSDGLQAYDSSPRIADSPLPQDFFEIRRHCIRRYFVSEQLQSMRRYFVPEHLQRVCRSWDSNDFAPKYSIKDREVSAEQFVKYPFVVAYLLEFLWLVRWGREYENQPKLDGITLPSNPRDIQHRSAGKRLFDAVRASLLGAKRIVDEHPEKRSNQFRDQLFKYISEVSYIQDHVEDLKKSTEDGNHVKIELETIGKFFQQVTDGPAPAMHLYRLYRAAELKLPYQGAAPLWQRIRIPGEVDDLRFEPISRYFKTIKDFKGYLQQRSREILESPQGFNPQDETDLEIFALMCRLYRSGESWESVSERVIQSLVPTWDMRVGDTPRPPSGGGRVQSSFDEIIAGPSVHASRRMPGNTAINQDQMRELSSYERVKEIMRREMATIDEVVQKGALATLADLEKKLGGLSRADVPELSEDSIQERVSLLLNHATSIDVADARRLFYALSVRSNVTLRSVIQALEEDDEIEKLCNLLEFINAGKLDPVWDGVCKRREHRHVKLLEHVTTFTEFEEFLLSLIEGESAERNEKPVDVQFSLTRGPASWFVGAICDSCVRDPIVDRSNIAFVTFAPAPTHERGSSNRFVHSYWGGCMLIHCRTADGAPALIVRGLNPQYRLLKKVSIAGLYDAFMDYVVEEIAKPLKINQVLAPYDMISGLAYSNRPLVHLAFKQRFRNSRELVELADDHDSTFNSIEVCQRCIRIWDGRASAELASTPWA